MRIITTDPYDTSYYSRPIHIYPQAEVEAFVNKPACGEEIRLHAVVNWNYPVEWHGPGLRADGLDIMIPNANTSHIGSYFALAGLPHCQDHDGVNVDVNCDSFRLYLPTGFSPNGDGANDILYIYGSQEVSELHFRIYNRWGQLVFETSDAKAGWDGTNNGGSIQTGIVAYTLQAVLKDGSKVSKKGNITVIR
ncbi:MAG: gliding motility-associated C-terminal domain-containing protein [Sphingobacteriales bacterium]|nr:MAG: gliding motility-associated C-terminal domain-containing protein [Sphingobacteriales bacterium]